MELVIELDIFIRVLQKTSKKYGQVIILYSFGANRKEVYFSSLETTHNRSIILASAVAIDQLKKPSKVNLYFQSNFGFKAMDNNKKWVNRDLGESLKQSILIGGHDINFINCSLSDKGKMYQNELDKKLKI